MNTNNARRSRRMGTWLPVGMVMLFSALGCSRRTESSTGQNSTGQNSTEAGTKMAEIDPAVSTALARMEATGKLEGVEFERYVGGGLPPPYYRSEQFRLIERDGRDTIEFAKANFSSKPAKDTPYPRDVYRLVAQPEDVKSLAHILRAGRAFDAAVPAVPISDAVKIELELTVDGKPHNATYYGLPQSLEALHPLVDALIARAQSQGQHKLEP